MKNVLSYIKYIMILVVFSAMFSILYYGSYRLFYKNKAIKEIAQNTTEEITEIQIETVIKDNENIIKKETEIILQSYDCNQDRLVYEYIEPSVDILGLNREGLITYIENYMNSPSIEDIQQGIYAFELISFSENKLILKKSYKLSIPTYAYYLILYDNKVVIYLNDKETVFEYTNICAEDLPVEMRSSLSEGLYLKNDYELYNFLETYSS